MLLYEFLPVHCLVNLARLCFINCENIHQIMHVCIAQPFQVGKARFFTFAGLSASKMYSFGSELHRMMSTFSLLSSRTMFFTREPRIPTHAPTGSTFSFALHTAILVRYPASRAMPRISTVPSAIS